MTKINKIAIHELIATTIFALVFFLALGAYRFTT
jgi:hypothetical protein